MHEHSNEAEPNLDQPIEVSPGRFKLFRDCTSSDLEGATKLAKADLRSLRFLAEVSEEIERLLIRNGVESLSELPNGDRVLRNVIDAGRMRYGVSEEMAAEIIQRGIREAGWEGGES